jgi:hypothetical protein
VREVVGHRERVHARGHAVFRGLVAELDDLLDHLALRLVQRAILGAQLDQCFEFVFVEKVPGLERGGRHGIGDLFAHPLQHARQRIEDRRKDPQHAHADPSEAVRVGERGEFRHEVADENDECENGQRLRPEGNARPFQDAQQIEAQHDQRQVHQCVGEQDDAEEAARILHEPGECRREVRAPRFQPLDVVGLE